MCIRHGERTRTADNSWVAGRRLGGRRRRHRTLDQAHKALVELPRVKVQGMLADREWIKVAVAENRHGLGKRFAGRRPKEGTSLPVDNGCQRSPGAIGDDRAAGGLCLQRREAEIILAGEYQRTTR